ncbi:BBE domain-containing protein [Nostoc sp. DedQUE09]|uniref:BBE domain-containing protein n=1 Tax=Nostoc sp. DedQUE09 TaxID=3075394 RepID=UPI002AD37E80|nr:BBE domain-containing protein [Nostoc sp. DedQUE09]MDZ7950758.1 BBE domain-containing protein [Nostoc sp. DedQUE09]
MIPFELWREVLLKDADLELALAPYAFKGGYVNLLDEQEQERVRLAFGSNYERLLDLKQKYDPDDVFRLTIGHLAPNSLTR